MSTVEQKLCVLEKINEKKNILFGPFSDIVTKVLKSQTWKDIFHLFQSQSYPMCQNRDYTYLRDTFWPNARKTTQVKCENAKKLDVNPKYSPIDRKVLEIIGAEKLIRGKSSANMETLRQWESLGLKSPHSLLESIPMESNMSTDGIPLKRKKRSLEETESSLKSLHKEKLELQVQYLKQLNYKMQLDCFEQENRLGIPHHPKFTADLVVQPDLIGETENHEDLCVEEDEEEYEDDFQQKTEFT